MRPGSALRAAALATAIIGVAACAAVLGIDDRQADPNPPNPDGSVPQDAGIDTLGNPDSPIPPADSQGADVMPAEGGDGGCASSACVLATGLDHPFQLGIDPTGQNLYWSNAGTNTSASDGTILKCSVNGCNNTPTVLASGLGGPTWLVVDDTAVYWANDGAGSIVKCSLNGCNNAPVPLFTVPSGDIPRALAVDATFIYWVETGNNPTVRRANKADGTGMQILADGDAGLDTPFTCYVDGTSLYVGDVGFTNFVGKVPTGGGALTVLASGLNCPCYFATNSANLFWVDSPSPPGQGVLMKADKNKADSGAAILGGQNQPVNLKIDLGANELYIANSGSLTTNDGTLVKISTGGGAAQTLASNQVSPEDIVVDSTSLYMINSGDLSPDGGDTLPNTGVLTKRPK